MIGKKVRVFWPIDSSWYTGTVRQFDASTCEHLLEYQDGDNEWVRIGESNTTSSAGAGPPETAEKSEAAELTRRNPPPAEGGPPLPPALQAGQYPPYPPHPYGYAPYGMMYPYPPPMGYFGGPAAPPSETDNSNGKDKRKTGPKAWSKHEDELLLNIVHSMQWPMKWTVVAQSLPERTGKQCRERYVNHLNPRLKVTDWGVPEDATVFYLYDKIGSHWAKMSKIIPGRTDNGIKNRFHNIRRQYEREDEHRMRICQSVDDFEKEIRLDRLRKIPDHLLGNTAKLWDMPAAVGVLAAQSVLDSGSSNSRNSERFGPFRDAEAGESCVRCGFLLPSVQTGKQICTKTMWCYSCTRVPPHACGNFLREVLHLRRCEDEEMREVIESWEDSATVKQDSV